MGSLFSSPRTSCLDPFLIDHFPLLTSQGSVRRGLWSEIWCLVTTLRNLGWEEMGTWGASPSAFVSFTLRTGHLRTMFGAGHGKVGREMQTLPGKPGTPLNGARRLGGLGATQHHPNYPRVRSLCQRASSSIAQSGGKSWGKAMQGREWEGGMIFSRNRPLVNCKKLNLNETNLSETKFFIKHPSKCEKKYWNHISSRIIERPHWRFVLAPFNANEFMKITLSNVISESIFPLACSYHKSSP